MDLQTLRQIDDFRWTIPLKANEQRNEVVFFGNRELLETMDEKVKEQITNVANLPGLIGPAMTMPDAHWGYGFPIGGVAAFDADEGGIISAGGVGFDISCGIRCLRSNLFLPEILEVAQPLADSLFQTIPAGVGEQGPLRLSIQELDKIMTKGARWALQQGFGEKEDLDFIEERGCIGNTDVSCVSETAKKRQRGEMGTLGSGNHYAEIQCVEKIYDQEAARAYGIQEGQIVISIHCGSRGLGHQIGTDYLISLAKAANRLGIHLPDRELACAPINSPEGKAYIGAMNSGINCALANRQILTHLMRQTFAEIIPHAKLMTLFDVSHNTCKYETHTFEGKPRKLYIHRKGATRAFGPGHPDLPEAYKTVGQPVIIGGSMGTASYILAGNSESENQAFASASHGAGRAMSRHQALKKWRGLELIQQLAEKGILIRSRSLRGVAEEAPEAYKDVDQVAYATEKSGLARRVAFLKPKICVKG